jgi:hypothetical protein
MTKALRVTRTASSLRGFQRDLVEGIIRRSQTSQYAGFDWVVGLAERQRHVGHLGVGLHPGAVRGTSATHVLGV